MPTFDTPDPITADLDLPAGRITLIAADHARTTVLVRPADADTRRDVTSAQQTTVAFDDGVLRVTAPRAKTGLLGSPGSVDVTIHLPTASRVEATSAAVEVHTEGRLGDVAVHGAHRRIEIADVEGLRLTAVDGDVHARYGRVGNTLKNDGSPALAISATSGDGDIVARSL